MTHYDLRSRLTAKWTLRRLLTYSNPNLRLPERKEETPIMSSLLFKLAPGALWECVSCNESGVVPKVPEGLYGPGEFMHSCEHPYVITLTSCEPPLVHVEGTNRWAPQVWSPSKKAPTNPTPLSFVEEAARIVKSNDEHYGEICQNFSNIAKMWSIIFKTEITPHQVALAMVCFKACRETYKPKRDNRLDMVGYVQIMESLIEPN